MKEEHGFVEYIVQHRLMVCFVILICTLGFSVPLAKMGVEMDNRPERFAPLHDPSFAVMEEMAKEFGEDNYFAILLHGDVWTPSFFRVIDELHEGLAAQKTPPRTIWSVHNAPMFLDVGGRRQLIREGKDVEKALAFRAGSRHLEEKLISVNGKWAAIWCQAPALSQLELAQYLRDIEEFAQGYAKDDISIVLGGAPVLSASLDALTMEESNRLGGIAFFLMTVFLGLWFRRISMVVGPFVVMMLGIVWTYGVMGFMGVSLSYMTSVLPGFLISVCVGDAMHIQALVHQSLQKGIPVKESIASSFRQAWKPVVFTTLTTAGGLLSFRFASLPAVSEMGTFGAIGVSMACMLSLILIPVCLGGIQNPSVSKATDAISEDRVLKWLLVCTRPKYAASVVLFFAALIGVSVWGMSTLQKDHDPLSWFPEGHSTREAMHVLDEHLGGAAELTIWVRSTDQQGVLSTRHLQDLYEMEKTVFSYSDTEPQIHFSRGVGVLDSLRLSYEASGQERGFDEFMSDRMALTRFVMQLNLYRPDWASDVVSADQHSAKFVYRLPWQSAQKFVPLREYLDTELSSFSERGLDVQATGMLYFLLATFGVLLNELVLSFGVAVVCISLLMIIFLQSVRLGLISLIPNLIPVMCTLGCMGFWDIPLDLGTVLFASIILGICVDDTIHFLHHFQEEYNKNRDTEASIQKAIMYAGKPILVTSLLLMSCMGVYLVSDLLSLHRFGLLMLISVFFALISDLLCTPILLRWLYSQDAPENP